MPGFAGLVLPSDLDGCHALALPRGVDVRSLAVAWFAGAAWEVLPLGPDDPVWVVAPTTGGGRHRGAPEAPPARPGRLRLTEDAGLTGPWRLTAAQAHAEGLGEDDLDLYALGLRVADPLVLGWMTAAARRCGGRVVSADRTQVIAPDPASAVDLTLWSGAQVASADLLPTVRPFLAGSRMGPVEQHDGAGYSVTCRFEFDGALTLSVQPRQAVPVAVTGTDWGPHGPWTYQVAWTPPDAAGPAGPADEQPSRLHVIARSRVAPVVARTVRAMLHSCRGIVVDDGGFPVPDDELARRGAVR